MFHIECFVDDKNLAKVKWMLFELGAYNVTDKPVRDNTNGAHGQRKIEDLVESFLAYSKKHKLRVFSGKHVREFAVGVGYAEKSYSHVISMLRNQGALKMLPRKPGAHLMDTRYLATPSKIKKQKAAS